MAEIPSPGTPSFWHRLERGLSRVRPHRQPLSLLIDAEVRRAIVMGAGEAARMLLAGLHQQGWIVLGLLDDDPAKRGARIVGAPVLGTLDDVSRDAVKSGATHVITAMPGATAAQRRR